MKQRFAFLICLAVLTTSTSGLLFSQEADKGIQTRYCEAARQGGEVGRGEVVFKSKEAACAKC